MISRFRFAQVIVVYAFLLFASTPTTAREYLESNEVVALLSSSIGLSLLGDHFLDTGVKHGPRWTEPNSLDRWVARNLAPPPSHQQRNFMQSAKAAIVNVAGGGLFVAATDAARFDNAWGRDVAQDQLLYWTGLASLSGVQSIVKGVVARQRPLARLAPDTAARRAHVGRGHDQRSFWSGHTSSAFYSSTFLNLRLRDLMRHKLTAEQWDSWSWVSPTVLFGWAGWIGYSRIHAYEHWFTDVAVGAVAGWAFAELFASFDDRSKIDTASDGAKAVPLFSLSFQF
jgi:membrane-associated phospholipid phosphatase